MFDYPVVGAGFAGCVLAERLARGSGKKVLICDVRPHIGGNAYDHHDEAGILVHRYGPHIFHTNSREVFDYLSRFTEWRPYQHRVRAWVDGHERKVTHPIVLSEFGGIALRRPGTWGYTRADTPHAPSPARADLRLSLRPPARRAGTRAAAGLPRSPRAWAPRRSRARRDRG